MRREHKKPKGAKPSAGKQPRGKPAAETKAPRHAPIGVQQSTPVWSFSQIDVDGPWCGNTGVTGDILKGVMMRLKNLEALTWSEIEGAEHHAVSVESLAPEAVKRLIEIGRDDIDTLFSLRVTGARRIWGVRVHRQFNMLWWDPEHKVCPSKKK